MLLDRALVWFCCAVCLSPLPLRAAHPLDPLGREEIAATREILKAAGKLHPTTRFASIELDEPPKAAVLGFQAGAGFPRRSFSVLYERASNSTWEAVVDLRARAVVSFTGIPGAQPAMLMEDYGLVQKIVRADPRWRAAIARRGIHDVDHVQLDPWTTGNFGWPEEKGRRIFRAVAFYKDGGSNAYARPIEGLVATVDVNAGRVIRLTDAGVYPVPAASAGLDEHSIGKLHGSLKPLRITQPEGASFSIAGNEIRWQKWRFRYAFNPREGLVLYTVGYEDQGRFRSILYRASLSEMVVPYADPGAAWYFRNPFDEGEYGLGRMTGALEPGTDAPANARFLDAWLNDDAGMPVKLPRAAALYERDGGLLWKHRDAVEGTNESRRARDLVLTWITTVGNYDYGFNWIFHQDGSLEMEVDLTGILEPKGTGAEREVGGRPREEGEFAQKVARQVLAVSHQHFFNFRLDLDIDSGGNSVVELNTAAVPPSPFNPRMNAFVTHEHLLATEREAERNLSLEQSRSWEILNPSVKNALGEPVGYMLMPAGNAVPYADPQSSVRLRAGFLNAQFWATPYRPRERYAAGDYINQSAGGEGLAKWTRANRSIENTDVVIWYTLGITHIPRPEDWPVMPVRRTGFKLVPAGFFSRNPALDVPKQR